MHIHSMHSIWHTVPTKKSSTLANPRSFRRPYYESMMEPALLWTGEHFFIHLVLGEFYCVLHSYLVGGWATPLKNMSSSIGMMKLTQYFWENAKFMATKPPTRYASDWFRELHPGSPRSSRLQELDAGRVPHR